MSLLTPINAYNVGSDGAGVLITVSDPVSGVTSIAEWTINTEFDSRQRTAQLESIAIDGTPRFRDLEEGWEGTIGFDRGSSFLDDFIAAKEAARYAGFAPPIITISQTITDPTGQTPAATYRFDGVTLRLDDAGRYTGNAKVEQKVGWRASFRVKTA